MFTKSIFIKSIRNPDFHPHHPLVAAKHNGCNQADCHLVRLSAHHYCAQGWTLSDLFFSSALVYPYWNLYHVWPSSICICICIFTCICICVFVCFCICIYICTWSTVCGGHHHQWSSRDHEWPSDPPFSTTGLWIILLQPSSSRPTKN